MKELSATPTLSSRSSYYRDVPLGEMLLAQGAQREARPRHPHSEAR